jgi:hypothetical protein
MSRERQAESEYDLKKQSQFRDAQMRVTSIVTKGYINNRVSRVAEKKANQSQTPGDGDSVQRVADSQQTIDNSKPVLAKAGIANSQSVWRFEKTKPICSRPNECKCFTGKGLRK